MFNIKQQSSNQTNNNQTNDLSEKRIQLTQQIRRDKRTQQISKRRNLNINLNSFTDNKQYNPFFSSLSQVNITQEMIKIKCLLESNDIGKVKQGLEGLRRLISEIDPPPLQLIVDLNFVPIIFQFALQQQDARIKVEACWLIANLCSGQHQICQYMIKMGLLPLFSKCLDVKIPDIDNQIIFGLGNIAGDCQQFRTNILNQGLLDKLTRCFQTDNMNTLFELNWMVGNINESKYFRSNFKKYKDVFIVFCKLFQRPQIIQNFQNFYNIAWSIGHFTTKSNDARNVLMKQDIVPIINKILQIEHEQRFSLSLIRILGNMLASQNKKHIEYIMKNDSLPIIQTFLNQKASNLMLKQVTWIFSNLAADKSYSKQVFQNQFLTLKLLQYFKNKPTPIKYQIAWIFNNMADRCDPQLIYSFYKSKNLIQQFVSLLDYTQNQNMVQIGILGIHNILRMASHFNINNQNTMANEISSYVVPALNKFMVAESSRLYLKCKQLLLAFFSKYQQDDE